MGFPTRSIDSIQKICSLPTISGQNRLTFLEKIEEIKYRNSDLLLEVVKRCVESWLIVWLMS